MQKYFRDLINLTVYLIKSVLQNTGKEEYLINGQEKLMGK